MELIKILFFNILHREPNRLVVGAFFFLPDPVDLNNTPTPASLWKATAGISLPENLWHGRRAADRLMADNVLLFPYTEGSSSRREHYGNYHPRFVLDVPVEAPVRFHVGEHDHAIDAGEMMLIFPHQYHDTRPGAGRGRWIAVTFDLHHPGEIASLRDSPRRPGPEGWLAFDRLIHAYRSDAPGVEIAFYLTRLLLILRDAPELPPEKCRLPSPEPERDAFLATVKRHLETVTSAAGLVAATGGNEAQVRALFRHHTGSSPADFIRRHRLARAARMLAQGEGSVTEIAERLGFSSLYAFSRMFKTLYGLSPKQYEKKIS